MGGIHQGERHPLIFPSSAEDAAARDFEGHHDPVPCLLEISSSQSNPGLSVGDLEATRFSRPRMRVLVTVRASVVVVGAWNSSFPAKNWRVEGGAGWWVGMVEKVVRRAGV